METIRKLRKQHQRLALQPLGVNPFWPRTWTQEAEMTGKEAEILALPIAPNVLQSMQAPNGALPFMAGADAVGDPNRPIIGS